MTYTLGEAAKVTGKSKTTIKRAIEKGRVSAQKTDTGEWRIDPAELHRVYKQVEHGTVTGGTPEEPPALQVRLEAIERENALLREQHERERAQMQNTIDDLRRDRDHWRQQATALLTDQRQAEPRSFWGWLQGRRRHDRSGTQTA